MIASCVRCEAVFLMVLAAATLSACGDDDGPAPGLDAGGLRMDAAATDGALPDAEAPDANCSTCEGCFTCRASACAAQLAACSAEPDCMAFAACATDDPVVVASCRSMHATGAAAFCAYWGCLTYTQCDAVCEDAVVCPRP